VTSARVKAVVYRDLKYYIGEPYKRDARVFFFPHVRADATIIKDYVLERLRLLRKA